VVLANAVRLNRSVFRYNSELHDTRIFIVMCMKPIIEGWLKKASSKRHKTIARACK
jgi:hypothetical protein